MQKKTRQSKATKKTNPGIEQFNVWKKNLLDEIKWILDKTEKRIIEPETQINRNYPHQSIQRIKKRRFLKRRENKSSMPWAAVWNGLHTCFWSPRYKGKRDWGINIILKKEDDKKILNFIRETHRFRKLSKFQVA